MNIKIDKMNIKYYLKDKTIVKITNNSYKWVEKRIN